MIRNDRQLEGAYEALGAAYLSLSALRKKLFPTNPERYASASQPRVRTIEELRADISVYLGLQGTEPLAEPPPFVIENDEQLRGTHRALGHLYRALASLRKDPSPSARQYGLFAEGPTHEICKLQAEIDSYLGLNSPAPHPAALHETPPDFGKHRP